jgi:hypothetical protein
MGTQEAVWLRRLLTELGMMASDRIPLQHASNQLHSDLQPSQPIKVSCDNQSSIQLARNPVFHARTKHIEIHHHFVRERLVQGEIALDYISTAEQPADILTKALPRSKFEHHRQTLGITSLSRCNQTL